MNNGIIDGASPISDANAVLDSKNCVCECGCKTFTSAYVVKKISPVYSGTGKEELFPIPVYVCTKCGTVMKEFLEKGNASRILGTEDEK